MKKVLIITYYWPPSGGAGVQRWMRFVKYLRSFGWEPIIYTVDNPNYALIDIGLSSQVPDNIKVVKKKIIEPNNILNKLSVLFKKKNNNHLYESQQQKGGKRSFLQKVSWFIRGNFFIPDARFLWVKPSVKFLSNLIKEDNIDLIVSTGPPHSLHLIAKKIKEKHSIPWVADFRDPWVSMDYLDEMYLTKFARKKHAKLEREVVTTADEVVVVGQTMYNEFFESYNRKVSIIYNGYENITASLVNVVLDEKFTIVHIGSFLKNRNCNDLWEVLSELVSKDQEFKNKLEIKLIGNVAPTIIADLERLNLNEFLTKIDYIPFAETQKHLYSAQVLLLPIDRIPNANFVLTGKIFEYLKSKRPIFLIGPKKGDAAAILEKCKAGYSCNFDDKKEIKKVVGDLFQLYLKNKNNIDSSNIEQFSGFELTKKMANLFDSQFKQEKK